MIITRRSTRRRIINVNKQDEENVIFFRNNMSFISFRPGSISSFPVNSHLEENASLSFFLSFSLSLFQRG